MSKYYVSVIAKAEQRLQEENQQFLMGADNEQDVAYWAAYLDGARAQQKEHEKQEAMRLADELKGYIPRAYQDW